MSAVRYYIFQRATAALMVPLIVVHLIMIFYATSNGLTAGDILGRTSGSVLWALFYETFVIAAAIHAAIGLRTVAADWLALSPRAQSMLMWTVAFVLSSLGTRAVIAVVFPGWAS